MKTQGADITTPRKLRKQAEKLLLQRMGKGTPGNKNEADGNKLLHELQVHQVELEMQNEELHRAYKAAETALLRYTLVFEQAPMGLLILDSHGFITELNFPAAEILGGRHFSLLGSNFKIYIEDESKTTFCEFFEKVYASHQKESCKIMLMGNNAQPLQPIYLEGIVIENDNKCILSLVDFASFND